MSEKTEWEYDGEACDVYYPGALVTVTGALRNLMLETAKSIEYKSGLEAIIRHTLYMSRSAIKSDNGSIFEVNYGLGREHKHQLKVKKGMTSDGKIERVRLMMLDED